MKLVERPGKWLPHHMNSPNTIQGNGATRYKMEECPSPPAHAKPTPSHQNLHQWKAVTTGHIPAPGAETDHEFAIQQSL